MRVYSVQMPTSRETPSPTGFNKLCKFPFNLRSDDFRMAMQDVYDFFHDMNVLLEEKGLERLDDTLRPAIMSGVLSDMLTASLGKHSRSLTANTYHNGHPDLVVKGKYAKNAVKAGSEGLEIKTTRKPGGAVDTHGARTQWLCVFVYKVDSTTEPAVARNPMKFTEVYLGFVDARAFRRNERSELGTRTATLGKDGLVKFRQNWVYRAP